MPDPIIGATGTLQHDGLSVQVTILDARENFGRLDVLVSPVGGEGQRWVNADRVKLEGGGGSDDHGT